MARMSSKAKVRNVLTCLVVMGILMMSMPPALLRLVTVRSIETTSVWVFRSTDGYQNIPVESVSPEEFFIHEPATFDPSTSPFILPPGSDISDTVYTVKKPEGSTKYITVSYFDPMNELLHLAKTDFSMCEYDKCKMTSSKESADAVIFLVAKLTRVDVPKFKRKPGQIWIMKTDEAPSRFSWFTSLNRTGLNEQFNWTLTHKMDSDITFVYGRLMENEEKKKKDYDTIYKGKTKTAAWFVSHCPVRSDRILYVQKMQTRTDIDVFGKCGSLSCGTTDKGPGVVAFRIQADKDTCFPMLSSTYKFYLAFENSMCQEYITEKFFKMFNNVEVVPVVRGGADYKRYFPPGTFVDAADFPSPEALADYLEDLGNDEEKYISYLQEKDKYRVVLDFPEWQCKLCEKLHTDHRKKTYSNVHDWWTHNSCHDPKDSLLF